MRGVWLETVFVCGSILPTCYNCWTESITSFLCFDFFLSQGGQEYRNGLIYRLNVVYSDGT